LDENGAKIAEDILDYYSDPQDWLRANDTVVVGTEPVLGYTLTEKYSKPVWVDPHSTLLAPQIVIFTYRKNELGDVHVLYYYDGDEKNILEE
jgi:hypothetical protein